MGMVFLMLGPPAVTLTIALCLAWLIYRSNVEGSHQC